MATRKLYYEDCHLCRFTARVTQCTPREDGGCSVVLDETAFYPEGGGQACDIGTLDGVPVTDVQEEGELVVHRCAAPLAPGRRVEGLVDYPRRFDLMQQHTGEHILSGLLHSRFGCHNVGFHMGAELVTVDFDTPIPSEALPEIEAQANRAVWRNLPVLCRYPAPEELERLPYRTKRALPWPVRIVEIPGIDRCACCGVHVASTGEVGLIKIFSVEKFRSGVRMEMACGERALNYLSAAFEQNRQVSQAFSAKILATGEAARRMNQTLAEEKFRSAGLRREVFQALAREYTGAGDVLLFREGLSSGELMELADAVAGSCGGTAAVFTGGDGGTFRYCLTTHVPGGDLRELGRRMNGALNGRGGGKSAFQQGSVRASREEIGAFFQK